jgi:hypothetical protein
MFAIKFIAGFPLASVARNAVTSSLNACACARNVFAATHSVQAGGFFRVGIPATK